MREDLRLVSAKSRAVIARLREPDRLPRTSGEVDLDGGVYIRADRRLVVYELSQPAFDPLREEAPPFHRRLLAARTVHEWGHLVFDAGIVRVPEERSGEHRQAVSDLAERWAEVVREMPVRLAPDVHQELRAMGGDVDSAGPALARATLHRISDYGSNVFSRLFLDPEELCSYVFTNVRHHLNEGVGPLAQLVRHAVELQYLGLAGGADPVRYLFETSYFAQYLVHSGVFREENVRAVVSATARVCACHEVDTSALRPPGEP